MKYKACCNRTCLLSHCEIRDNGGCICACAIHDIIGSFESIISGETIWLGTGCVYIPDAIERKKAIDKMGDEQKTFYAHCREKEAPQLLNHYQKQFKEYCVELD